MSVISNKIIHTFLAVICFFLIIYTQVQAAEPIIVAIDPGHGGENLGADYQGYTEKDMNMIVAQAMKEELEKYEDITVYLTRETDEDISLKDRVEYAASQNADFLFCLHFNMSERHIVFGAEAFVCAYGENYQKGYTFASVLMEQFDEIGIYPKGIKTRLNDKEEDYYGIIRHSRENNLPVVLIEHGYLDHENDREFYDSEEKLKHLGVTDATAVAQYYGLKSDMLEADYSSYQSVETPLPDSVVRPDTSEPDICKISMIDIDEETGKAEISLVAEDYESGILYYQYSLDGGITYADMQRWKPNETDTVSFTIELPSGVPTEIVAKAYNGYDLAKESLGVPLSPVFHGEEIRIEESRPRHDDGGAEDKEEKVQGIGSLVFVILFAIVTLVFLLAAIKVMLSLRRFKRK